MAAYNYYPQTGGHPAVPPSYDQVSPSPDPFNRLPTSQHGYMGAGASPWGPANPDHDPHYARYSQNSLASDNGAYPIGGRRNYGEQDAENIPLQQAYSRSDWMQQPTHYPPSPEAQHPVEPSVGRGGRRRKKRFFSKKIPWVTYLLTAVQVAVFIAELVKSGKSKWMESGLSIRLICPCRSTDRISHSNQAAIQSNDRPLPVYPDQHGSPVYSLHEERGRSAEQRPENQLELS